MFYNKIMNKILKCATLCLTSIICFFCIPLGACKPQTKYVTMSADGYILNTSYTLTVTHDMENEEVRQRAVVLFNDITAYLKALENSLSVSVETSYVSAFNSAQAGEKVELDKTSYEVLLKAIDLCKNTQGYFNPAVYYNVELYGFLPMTTDLYKEYGTKFTPNGDGTSSINALPNAEYVTAFANLAAQFENIKLESEDGKYYATKPEAAFVELNEVVYALKVDLGGIGKGYAVDYVSQMMTEHGFNYGNFSFGGSSIAFKQHYGEGEYSVYFRNPRPTTFEETYFTTKIANSCLSTSGDYERYYIHEGIRYSHIINPKTGSPVNTGIATATVLDVGGAEGDALSTAIMTMGLEKAVEFINKNLSDKRVLFVYIEGDKMSVVTNMAEDEFEFNDKKFTLISSLDRDGKIVLDSKENGTQEKGE